jgi:ribonuclease III
MTEQDQLTKFQSHIGLHFLDPNILRRALTHRSFVNEQEANLGDNERLEFLGDAILDFVVGDMLYRRFVELPEGELTQLRAALVRTDSLAMLANDIQLGEFLFIGKGEENSGGRKRINNLCRGFEALIAGIYMDRGLEAVREFVLPRLNTFLEYVIANDLHKDARSILQERSQADIHVTPVYRMVDANGPDHEREFSLEVLVGDIVLGQGMGSSKRVAAQAAARDALKRLEEKGWPDEAYILALEVQEGLDEVLEPEADEEALESDEI